MSQLAQFMRGTVAIGELSENIQFKIQPGSGAEIVEFPMTVPYYMTTICGSTYLRTGTLIDYTTDYQELFNVRPKLTIKVTSNATFVNASGGAQNNWGLQANCWVENNVAVVMAAANGRYYSFVYGVPYASGGGSYYMKTSNRGTLPASPSSNCIIDAMSPLSAQGDWIGDAVYFPATSNLYMSAYVTSYGSAALYDLSSGNTFSTARTTVTATPGGGALVFVDCNTDYMVVSSNIVGNTSQQIKTTTNGTSWTNRIPTLNNAGGTAKTIGRMSYSRCGSTFVYITTDGYIYTAADGYTMSNIGTVSNLPQASNGVIWIPTVYGQKIFQAHSANESLWILSPSKILSTTDCVTFTCTELSGFSTRMDYYSSLGIAGSQPGGSLYLPRIYYHEPQNRYYLVHMYSAGQIWTSDDGGATWQSNTSTFIARDIDYVSWDNTTKLTHAQYTGFTNANGWMVNYCHIGTQMSGTRNCHGQIFGYQADYNDLDGNPTYVGWMDIRYNGNTELWLRIK